MEFQIFCTLSLTTSLYYFRSYGSQIELVAGNSTMARHLFIMIY